MLFFRLIAFRVCIQKRPKIGKERKWKNHQFIVSLVSMSFVFRIGQLLVNSCYLIISFVKRRGYFEIILNLVK